MAVTIVTGARATGGTQTIDQESRVIDMSDEIHLLDPNEAALSALLMKMRKLTCHNEKFEWLEDDYLPTSTTSSTTIGPTITALVVTGVSNYFRVGDVIKDTATGEVMYVRAVPDANTVTITRSVGGTAAATITSGDPILIVGNANSQGSGTRIIKTTQKTPKFNYVQLSRWPFGITGTLKRSKTYGGDDLSYQSRKAGIEYRKQIEMMLWFGEGGRFTTGPAGETLPTAGDTPITFTDGVVSLIGSNGLTVQTDPVTAESFEDFLREAFRYGPATKIFFCSRLFISILNRIAQARIQTVPATESFPLALREWVSGHGTVYMVPHNQFTGAGGTTKAYGGWGILVDMDSILLRELLSTEIRTNIQDNDIDGRTDEYIGECGLMLIQALNHAVYNSVTTSA